MGSWTTDADSDGDGEDDYVEMYGSGKAGGGQDPLQNNPMVQFWAVELTSLEAVFSATNPDMPASGKMKLPKGSHVLLGGPLIDMAGNPGGAVFDWAYDERNQVDIAEYKFECPRSEWDSGGRPVCNCTWVVRSESDMLAAAVGEIQSSKAYLGLSIGPGADHRVEKTYCDGDIEQRAGAPSIAGTYGLILLQDLAGNLPLRWDTEQSGSGRYTLGVPESLLRQKSGGQSVEAAINIANAVPDGQGTSKVQAKVKLTPIYVEMTDTPNDRLPVAPVPGVQSAANKFQYQLDLHPDSIAGTAVKAMFKVRVYDRTEYPGYAMNADFDENTGNMDKNGQPDVLCEEDLESNSLWDCELDQDTGELIMQNRQRSEPHDPNFVNVASFTLSTFDFAAYAKIQPGIEELQLGPGALDSVASMFIHPDVGQVIAGGNVYSHTTLPIDRGKDNGGCGGVAGNRIADCGWKTSYIVDIPDCSPADDMDSDPAYGPDGDGLVNLEEYRGFVVYGDHKRTNPFYKEVFISSNLPEGIEYAASALPTVTYRIGTDEFNQDSLINWNANGIQGHRSQCAIVVNESTHPDPPVAWDWARNLGNIPGTPCDSAGIDIYTNQIVEDMPEPDVVLKEKLVMYTIGHEVAHGVSIPCRACVCGGQNYSLMCTTTSTGPPPGCLFSNTPNTYDEALDLPHLDLVSQ